MIDMEQMSASNRNRALSTLAPIARTSRTTFLLLQETLQRLYERLPALIGGPLHAVDAVHVRAVPWNEADDVVWLI